LVSSGIGEPGMMKVIRDTTFVPLNKTASPDSVISKAFQNGGVLYREEQITMGGLTGKFAVEAAAFKCFASPTSRLPSTAILSLLCKAS
jgi:hypothetical protein